MMFMGHDVHIVVVALQHFFPFGGRHGIVGPVVNDRHPIGPPVGVAGNGLQPVLGNLETEQGVDGVPGVTLLMRDRITKSVVPGVGGLGHKTMPGIPAFGLGETFRGPPEARVLPGNGQAFEVDRRSGARLLDRSRGRRSGSRLRGGW